MVQAIIWKEKSLRRLPEGGMKYTCIEPTCLIKLANVLTVVLLDEAKPTVDTYTCIFPFGNCMQSNIALVYMFWFLVISRIVIIICSQLASLKKD